MRLLRSSAAAAIAAAVLFGFGTSLAHAAYPIVFSRDNGVTNGAPNPGSGLFASDDSGSAPRLITEGRTASGQPPEDPALSPDGSRVVYADGCESVISCSYAPYAYSANVMSVPWLGGSSTVVGGSTWSNQQGRPTFAPDGQTVFYQRHTSTWDIYAADISGATVRPVITWASEELSPSVSADGTRLTFVSSPNGGSGSFLIYVTDVNGGAPRSLGVYGWNPRFSPDGTKIAYQNPADGKIYIIPAAGGTPTALTRPPRGASDDNPDWSPDGAWIIYSRANTIHKVAVGGKSDTTIVSNALAASYSQPRTVAQQGAGLAAQFRPILRFDSYEEYRPLTVDALFSELDPATGIPLHHVVSGSATVPLTSESDLTSHNSTGSLIQMGTLPSTVDPSQQVYRSPDPACNQGTVLRDCDTGQKSAIYYHATINGGGYDYVDYWFFYRYNGGLYDPVSGQIYDDRHEGDWEGLTVARSETSTSTSFDWVAFGQHNGLPKVYARDALMCDGGGLSSCGSDAQRVWVYVADETQASYPRACPSNCVQSVPTGGVLLPEGNHDGLFPWGRNNEPSTSGELQQMPLTGANRWTDWLGRWGAMAPSPRSPGQQDRFNCPALHAFDPSPCGQSVRVRKPEVHARAAAAAARTCGGWFGAGVAAMACSPARLRAALRAGTTGRRGAFSLRLPPGSRAAIASTPGVAQAVANLVRPGQRLYLRGDIPSDTLLFIRGQSRLRQVEATFTNLRLPRGESLEVSVDRRLRVHARTASGRSIPGRETYYRLPPRRVFAALRTEMSGR